MEVAVVGGGVVGVCTAYFLAQAGHEVVLFERQNNVAEQASFGNAGVIAPAHVTPWAAPGMPQKILSHLFAAESPVLLRPSLNRAMLRWVRLWLRECQLERYRINKERMQRVAYFSRDVLDDLQSCHQLEFEQVSGVLQLFRDERDLRLAQPGLDMLRETEQIHHLISAEAAHQIEPALKTDTPLAGALHLPNDRSGNCALFTKQMKTLAQAIGVRFEFNSAINIVRQDERRIILKCTTGHYESDAVVLANGVDSARLLATLGVKIPLHPVKGFAATVAVRDFDAAPKATVLDESYKVAMTRMGNRMRIAGIAELCTPDLVLRKRAVRTLVKVASDWFPDAANYNTAQFWTGARPMLPDGAPLLGATPFHNVFINIGHGSSGWAMAPGCGKILADLVSGHTPEINMDGLQLERYH